MTNETLTIIESTIPVLEAHGEAISKQFYKRLLNEHPELNNVFNQTHQQTGGQPRALASTVYQAALHIRDLSAILPVVEPIAHKHRSLQVTPDQYQIVGATLLQAIQDVLGENATPEIIEAWGTAYGEIANAFISREKTLYREAPWKGYQDFIVKEKIKESSVITSFYLIPPQGHSVPDYHPGQYITVRVKPPGSSTWHPRQYSLSDRPHKEYIRISVKRESGNNSHGGGIVSQFLHDFIEVGDTLPIAAPAGTFTLDAEQCHRPLVLISGGVGLTPLLSMLNATLEADSERPVTFIHAAINGNAHAFSQHVRDLARDTSQIFSFVCYESPTESDRQAQHFNKEGYLDTETLKTLVPANADCYFCGPLPFMNAVESSLKDLGVPDERRHFEIFGPVQNLGVHA